MHPFSLANCSVFQAPSTKNLQLIKSAVYLSIKEHHMEERDLIILQEANTPHRICNTLQAPITMVSLPSPQPNIIPQPGIDSQRSIVPQSSIESQQSGLLSQVSSLGFLPSLASLWPDSAIEEIDHHCLATIKGVRGTQISSLTVMGDYLYAGASSSNGSSNSIRVWQKASLKECGEFGSGYGAVKALVVAGDRILSAHQDLKIRVWSRGRTTNRRQPKQVPEGDNDLHVELLQEMQPTAIVSFNDNSHKLLASMPTVKDYIKSFIPPKNYVQVRRHHKRLWIEHVDNISMLAVGGTSADPVLYSASWDRTIKVWKLSEFKCVESFKAHDDAINALLVAPEGFLYTASADTKIKVWGRHGTAAASAGQKHSFIVSLDAHKSAVNALALSQDTSEGRHATLYSAGCDRGIVVWEREESAQHMVATGVLRGHRHAVLCLVSTGSMLCSGSADRTIRVWRRSAYGSAGGLVHSCVAILQGHSGPVKCLSLVYDAGGNHLLYSSSLDYDIKLWKLCGCVNEGEEEDEVEMASTEPKAMDPKSQQIWKFNSV